jgi:hypothetical protein
MDLWNQGCSIALAYTIDPLEGKVLCVSVLMCVYTWLHVQMSLLWVREGVKACTNMRKVTYCKVSFCAEVHMGAFENFCYMNHQVILFLFPSVSETIGTGQQNLTSTSHGYNVSM